MAVKVITNNVPQLRHDTTPGVLRASYPHEPGTLYDCAACEVLHFFDGDVHCAIIAELIECAAHARP